MLVIVRLLRLPRRGDHQGSELNGNEGVCMRTGDNTGDVCVNVCVCRMYVGLCGLEVHSGKSVWNFNDVSNRLRITLLFTNKICPLPLFPVFECVCVCVCVCVCEYLNKSPCADNNLFVHSY